MKDNQAIRSPARTFARTVTVVLLGVIVLGIAWSNLPVLQTHALPALNLPFIHANFVLGTVAKDSAAAGYGLRTGDNVDLRSLPLQDRLKIMNRIGRLTIQKVGRPGELIHFTVTRAGSQVAIRARVPSPSPGSPYAVIIKRIAGTLSVIFTAMLLLLKPTRMLWGFYLFILGETAPTPFVFDLLPATLQVILSDTFNALVPSILFCAGLLGFVSRFPGDVAKGWRIQLDRAAIPLGLLVALITVGDDILWQSAIPHPEFFDYLSAALPDAIIVVALVCLISGLARLSSVDRQRLKWVVAGMCVFLATRAYFQVAPAYWGVTSGGWFQGWPQSWTN
ncbi:MAG: hypothetical protein M3007_00320, partial [Candidatus Eremiobacteraeota bacterium]|nr:hypothetical protein [Candidatus Eremiobacteraeota bacterium]